MTEIVACASNPCQNGATCFDQMVAVAMSVSVLLALREQTVKMVLLSLYHLSHILLSFIKYISVVTLYTSSFAFHKQRIFKWGLVFQFTVHFPIV